MTPDEVIDSLPMLAYTRVDEMTPAQVNDFQKWADFGAKIGMFPEKIDVGQILLKPF